MKPAMIKLYLVGSLILSACLLTIAIIFSRDLAKTTDILNAVLLPTNQDEESKAKLAARIETLEKKKVEMEALVGQTRTAEDNFSDLEDDYFGLSLQNNLLSLESKNHENAIEANEAIIGIYKKIKESLLLSQSALARVNKVISDAIRQIKYRIGLLQVILRNLGHNIPEEILLLLPLHEPLQIRAYPGIEQLIHLRRGSAYHEGVRVSEPPDTVAGVRVQEKDIISIVDARISIIEVFNQRLRDFLKTINSESDALKEKISELEKSNKELQQKNEELSSKRKKLDSELALIQPEIETLSANNHKTITEHNHFLEEYQTELGKQIALLEAIGKARLQIEQAKK